MHLMNRFSAHTTFLVYFTSSIAYISITLTRNYYWRAGNVPSQDSVRNGGSVGDFPGCHQ